MERGGRRVGWIASGHARDRLGQAGEKIDWERRAALDSASVAAAPEGAKRAARTPPTRARRAQKSAISWSSGGGVSPSLSVIHTEANAVHDSKALLQEAVEDAISPIRRGPRGRPGRPPRKRPKKLLHADKGYDYPRCRKALKVRGGLSQASLGAASSRARGWDGTDGSSWSGRCMVAQPLSGSEGALRAASRHPPGVP